LKYEDVVDIRWVTEITNSYTNFRN